MPGDPHERAPRPGERTPPLPANTSDKDPQPLDSSAIAARMEEVMRLIGFSEEEIEAVEKVSDVPQTDWDIEYKSLLDFDLTEEMVIQNAITYGNVEAATLYSSLEWDIHTLSRVWSAVFEPLLPEISQLQPGSKILLPGCGTLRDLLLFALINKDIEVNGFDLSGAMLEVGSQRLGLEGSVEIQEQDKHVVRQVILLAVYFDALLHQANIDSWVYEVFEKINEWVNTMTSKRKTDLFPLIHDIFADELQDRISLHQADMTSLNENAHESDSQDIISLIACVPHAKKSRVLGVVNQMSRWLNLGGVFHFNLRADNSSPSAYSTEATGKVFMDTVLGADKPRFFNTYTASEIERLCADISTENPGLTLTTDYHQTAHPDSHKPGFINIFLRKPVAKTSGLEYNAK